MPPDPKPTTELQSVKPEEANKQPSSWRGIATRSRNYGRVAALLGAILVLGGAGGYFISVGLRQPTSTKASTPKVETLSPTEIGKLSQIGSQLGSSNQTLTIAANSVFQGKVNIGSTLTLGGTLNANGPVLISSLAISGQTNLSNLAVSKNLQVAGLTNAQNGLTVQGLAAVNGNLSVSGAAAIGSLTTSTITAKSIQLNGPFSVNHIVSSGPPVSSSSGAALGSGGTTSVSGNDMTGTVTMNIGTGASAGTLVTVTFRASYGSNVHVLLTPASASATAAPVYVTHTPSGFSVNASSPPSGSYTFDYFVVD